MPSPLSNTVLFKPTKIGRMLLQHRIVMSPLTRYRANDAHAHTDIAREYYAQRASEKGTLIITEATYVAQKAGGQANAPGLWTGEQLEAWKKVTDAVHAKGSFIYAQLWALGRAAYPEVLHAEDPSLPYVSSSAVQLKDRSAVPRPLTIPEIQEYVKDYGRAAKNAVFEAGFDGVEIHNANGYLLDQFLQDVVNKRTDEYGGSIENRARFSLEVVKAVTEAVGQDRVGIRLSPWGLFQGMKMDDPVPQFSYLINSLRDTYPNISYIHFVEPPLSEEGNQAPPDANDVFRSLWAPRPILTALHESIKQAVQKAETKGDIIVFGRHFLANPDLPRRLKEGFGLNAPDYSTFYKAKSPDGYLDYPLFDEIPENERDKLVSY